MYVKVVDGTRAPKWMHLVKNNHIQAYDSGSPQEADKLLYSVIACLKCKFVYEQNGIENVISEIFIATLSEPRSIYYAPWR